MWLGGARDSAWWMEVVCILVARTSKHDTYLHAHHLKLSTFRFEVNAALPKLELPPPEKLPKCVPLLCSYRTIHTTATAQHNVATNDRTTTNTPTHNTHRFELLPPPQQPSAPSSSTITTTTQPPPQQPSQQSLNPHDLQLVRLYGQMHAAHIDTGAAAFRLYRLGKDQVGGWKCVFCVGGLGG